MDQSAPAMAAKSKVTRVLAVAVWPLGWSFGFVMGSCFRRTEKKWRPPCQKRSADWRQALEPAPFGPLQGFGRPSSEASDASGLLSNAKVRADAQNDSRMSATAAEANACASRRVAAESSWMKLARSCTCSYCCRNR